MGALGVFLLAAGACLLLPARRRPWPGVRTRPAGRGPGTWFSWRPKGSRGGVEVSMPRLVRQLSALLATGRSGPMLWAALAEVLAVEAGTGGSGPVVRPTSAWPPHSWQPEARTRSPGRGFGKREGAAGAAAVTAGGAASTVGDATLLVVLAVQRAVTMGLPVASALRSAACQWSGPAHFGVRTGQGCRLTESQVRTWLELAACFEICAASGAPVAAVLSRLATRLEAELDAAALRETALSGPRATVRLLGWLPFIGLLLGMAMGVDPLRILLGGPLGWACLAMGLALVAAGKWWSSRLIGAAARPAGQGEFRGFRGRTPAGPAAGARPK